MSAAPLDQQTKVNPSPIAAMDYLVDAWQRAILTWDVLRERGNQYLEHERPSKPPVLAFDYDMVLDGRSSPSPANYALVRIKPGADHPPTDPNKRPFVVIDPRAGHGPGIGGFKIDSEIGIALKQGHPCYFVMFFPQPVPGQTIESVCAAEIAFVRKVNELHPHAEGRPFLIGNCQGGWALMMLAALAPNEIGPDPAGRLAAVLLGGRRRQEPDALRRAACSAAPGWPRWRATSATASSTAPTSSTTSRASTPRTPTGRSSTTSTPRSTRSRRASCSSRSGGAATS